MPGPRQSLDDYLKDRLAQLHQLGGVVRDAFGQIAEDGSWAMLHGWVTFGERNEGLLSVYEHLTLDPDGIPHRKKYGYQCQYRDQFLFRYDRDPVQHPELPEHKHLPPDERRIPADRVTLQSVTDEFWPMVVERDADEIAMEDGAVDA